MPWRAFGESFWIFLPTLVVPQHPTLRRLQDDVAVYSARDGGFGVGGYDPPGGARAASIEAIEDGRCRGHNVPAAAGESISVEVRLDEGDSIQAQIQDAAGQVITEERNARTGTRIAANNLDAGIYTIYFCNITGGPHAVTYWRNWLRNDVVTDYLSAIFDFARSSGLAYANLAPEAFNNGQLIRRPDESIEGMGANCVEGALLFASFLEMFGVEAVIIVSLRNGHAFVGMRTAPGSRIIMPIETTVVNDQQFSAGSAINYAIAEFNCWVANDADACERTGMDYDPDTWIIDVSDLRQQGILPQPQ